MEVLAILALLLITGLVIYSIPAINTYSYLKFDYKPFQLKNLMIIAIPSIIFVFLFMILDDKKVGYENYIDLNHIVLYIFIISSCVVVGVSIFNHTNSILITVYATCLLLVGSIFIAFIVIFAVLNAMGKSYKKKK
jgi:hypothetical protein